MNRPALFAFTLAFGCSLACYITAGSSLNLFIGGLLFTAILVPYTPRRDAGFLFVVAGIALVWLLPVFNHTITISQFVRCVTVLLAFAAAISSTRQMLPACRINEVLAAAITTVLALAWLTWPIWAAPHLAGATVIWPVKLHPLFAINSVCNNLGIWTEQRIAYHLTNLGQDVQYQLPTSILPAVIAHLTIAILIRAGIDLTHRSSSPTSPPAS